MNSQEVSPFKSADDFLGPTFVSKDRVKFLEQSMRYYLGQEIQGFERIIPEMNNGGIIKLDSDLIILTIDNYLPTNPDGRTAKEFAQSLLNSLIEGSSTPQCIFAGGLHNPESKESHLVFNTINPYEVNVPAGIKRSYLNMFEDSDKSGQIELLAEFQGDQESSRRLIEIFKGLDNNLKLGVMLILAQALKSTALKMKETDTEV